MHLYIAIILPLMTSMENTGLYVGLKADSIEKMQRIIEDECYKNPLPMEFYIKKSYWKGNKIYGCSYDNCEWELQVHINSVTISSFNAEQNLCCILVSPKPSKKNLMRHRDIASYAQYNSPKLTSQPCLSVYGLRVTPNMASDVRMSLRCSPYTEESMKYRGVEPWLIEYCKLNNTAQYRYKENAESSVFINCALLLPVGPIIQHSFLRTLQINGEFSKTKNGIVSQIFVLTMGDRKNTSAPIAFGCCKSESSENYADFLSMLQSNIDRWDVIKDTANPIGVIHDRHVSFLPAYKIALPSHIIDRIDIIHFCRNIEVY
jgi:hypothetical protein